MPYRYIEETQRRSSEKILPFATYANVIGMVVGGFPWFLFSSIAVGAAQAILFGMAIGGALVGFLVTLDIAGHAVHERVRAWGRARIRHLLHVSTIAAHTLPGTAPPTVSVTALPAKSRIRPVRGAAYQSMVRRRSDAHFSSSQLPD